MNNIRVKGTIVFHCVCQACVNRVKKGEIRRNMRILYGVSRVPDFVIHAC